jgi:hypothetical protein
MKILVFLSFFIIFISLTKSSPNTLSFNYSSFNKTILKNISLFVDAILTNNSSVELTKIGDDTTPSLAKPDTAGQLLNNVFLTSSSISFFTNFSFSISKLPRPNFTGHGFTFFFTADSLQFEHPPLGRFELTESYLS